MEKIIMDRVSCHVTAHCNLRCKMCAVYIPRLYELGNVPEYNIEDIKKSFKIYFDIVEHVRLISLTGGEPILYGRLDELIEFLLQYEDSFSKLEIFTNGSLKISEQVLNVMKKSDKLVLFMDNYGSEISKEVVENEKVCLSKGVRCTVRKYYGEDAYLGGWVDRSILPERLSNERAKEHFLKCVAARPGGRLLTIFGKYITFCATPYCGYRIGAVPKEDVLQIALADDSIPLEEKSRQLKEWNNIDFNPGCAWCNGLGVYENVERFVPGEQVNENE